MVTDASQLTWPDIQLTDNDSRVDCQKVSHFQRGPGSNKKCCLLRSTQLKVHEQLNCLRVR